MKKGCRGASFFCAHKEIRTAAYIRDKNTLMFGTGRIILLLNNIKDHDKGTENMMIKKIAKILSMTIIDSFPPDYMLQFTRDPYPETVVWDLSARAPERSVEGFYYLSASKKLHRGLFA